METCVIKATTNKQAFPQNRISIFLSNYIDLIKRSYLLETSRPNIRCIFKNKSHNNLDQRIYFFALSIKNKLLKSFGFFKKKIYIFMSNLSRDTTYQIY